MNKIYIFSGLGVDKRVFDNIDFGDLDVCFIDWITPEKNESIESYAYRISKHITTTRPTIIGLSFGGMIAVEIAKILDVEKLVLIASSKSKNELPIYYRLLGKLKLNRLIPSSLFKMHHVFMDWIFGINLKSDKKLLKNILKDTDPFFLSWAIDKILNWNNTVYPQNCIHIHGEKDRLIPINNIRVDFIIKNGGHFMTVTQSSDIEKTIKSLNL